MTDVVDKPTRSRMMAGIRGKNTKPEVLLRKALHAKGIRFRLHAANLPGRPDIVFPRFKAVCFVHGCFWHQHAECKLAATPKTRPDFWQQKFSANAARDRMQREQLAEDGWHVAIVWECAMRRRGARVVADHLITWLHESAEAFDLDELANRHQQFAGICHPESDS